MPKYWNNDNLELKPGFYVEEGVGFNSDKFIVLHRGHGWGKPWRFTTIKSARDKALRNLRYRSQIRVIDETGKVLHHFRRYSWLDVEYADLANPPEWAKLLIATLQNHLQAIGCEDWALADELRADLGETVILHSRDILGPYAALLPERSTAQEDV